LSRYVEFILRKINFGITKKAGRPPYIILQKGEMAVAKLIKDKDEIWIMTPARILELDFPIQKIHKGFTRLRKS